MTNLQTAPGAVDDALTCRSQRGGFRRSRGTAQSSAIRDQRFPGHRDLDRRNCRRSSEAENYPARKALKTLKTGKSTSRRRPQSTMRWSVPTSTRRIDRSRGLAQSSAIRRQALRGRRDVNQHNRCRRGGNFPGRKALKIHKTVKESRFVSTLSRLRFPSRNGHRRCPIIAASTPSSLRAQRSNPGATARGPWIASSQGLLAMTDGVIHVPQVDFLNSGRLHGPCGGGRAVGAIERHQRLRRHRDIDRRNCRRSSEVLRRRPRGDRRAVRSPGSRREGLTAKRSRPEMAPQRLEKIESAPGNGMASEASNPQDVVHGRAAESARPPNPQNLKRISI